MNLSEAREVIKTYTERVLEILEADPAKAPIKAAHEIVSYLNKYEQGRLFRAIYHTNLVAIPSYAVTVIHPRLEDHEKKAIMASVLETRALVLQESQTGKVGAW